MRKVFIVILFLFSTAVYANDKPKENNCRKGIFKRTTRTIVIFLKGEITVLMQLIY
jgi:hypothetical protein